MKRIINGLIFALFSLPVLAQDSDKKPERWYEVEIILFEQLNPVSTASELWPLDIEQPDLSNAIDLFRSPEEAQIAAISESSVQASKDPYLDTPYLILPQEQYQLTNAYQKLVNSENYLPLVHVAWRQVIPPREQPDRIFIHDKLNSPVDEAPGIKPEPTLATPPRMAFSDGTMLEENAMLGTPEHNLSGIISLGLGRYIHVEADLLLYKPESENAIEDELAPPIFSPPESMPFIFDDYEIELLTAEQQTPELFRIQGNLRLPSKEVHYLDHPLVGMLILFTPYEVPEPEITEELEDQPMPTETTIKDVIVRPGRAVEDRSF